METATTNVAQMMAHTEREFLRAATPDLTAESCPDAFCIKKISSEEVSSWHQNARQHQMRPTCVCVVLLVDA